MTPRAQVRVDIPRSRVNAFDPVLCDYGPHSLLQKYINPSATYISNYVE